VKKAYKIIISLLFIENLVCPYLIAASFTKNNIGTTGGAFLKVPKGVRAVGMGEAYCGVSDNLDAIYWNPAGLNNIENLEISAMHSMWFENIFFDYFSLVYPTKIGVFGFSANYLGMDEIDKYNNTGTASGDTYSPYDLLFYASYAAKMKKHFIGANLKVINSVIDDESATAFGLDIGYMKKFIDYKVVLGGTVQNIGTKMKFRDEADALPLNIKVGIAVNELLKGLVLSSDVNFPVDNDPSGHLGAEYGLLVRDIGFFVRSGYKTTTINDLETEAGLSLGGGVKYRGVSIDYTWVPYGKLGDTNRFSLAFTLPSKLLSEKAEIIEEPKKLKNQKVQKIIKPKKVNIPKKRVEIPAKKIENPEKKVIGPKKEEYELMNIWSEGEKIQLKYIYFFEAHDLFLNGRYEESIKIFNKVLNFDPQHEESLMYIERAKEAIRNEQ
jgi:hypothetical protein